MPRGGIRSGAGRPKGTGKYGEVTKAIRLPVSIVDQVLQFVEQRGLCYPLFPADDLSELPSDSSTEKLDIGSYLIQNPAATFIVRVTGESMLGVGIFPDDLLIVDRSIRATNGDVVIACVDGEFVVKCLYIQGTKVELRPANRGFKPVKFNDASELNIWGVVKNVIHRV
ncbi:MAG: LexA family protein [Thermoguttaceae bacterium]|jgi:DNA polymerase V